MAVTIPLGAKFNIRNRRARGTRTSHTRKLKARNNISKAKKKAKTSASKKPTMLRRDVLQRWGWPHTKRKYQESDHYESYERNDYIGDKSFDSGRKWLLLLGIV